MKAEIVAIGSELTSGAKLDTNSQWLSLQLAELGIPVAYHTTMSDSLDAMIDVFRTASARCDLVLITGGLGPTLDDITRHAMAALAGVELVLDQDCLDHITTLFAKRDRPMPDRNRVQAMLPEGSRAIDNPRGTAPGIWMALTRHDGSPCQLIAMPGVPSEMKRMFGNEIKPHLEGSGLVMRRALVHCYGVGESTCEEMLGELTARDHDPEVGITVHEATITLRINACGSTEQECVKKIDGARQEIHQRLGDLVFGEADDTLESVVMHRLRELGLTVATAEIGTGGVLSAWITDADPGGSGFGGGGVGADAARMLKVMGATREDALSSDPQTQARQLAEACRELHEADFGLGVADCPDYDPDDKEVDVPSTWVACAGPNGTETRSITLLGDVSFTRNRTAKTILNLLREKLATDAPPVPGQTG